MLQPRALLIHLCNSPDPWTKGLESNICYEFAVEKQSDFFQQYSPLLKCQFQEGIQSVDPDYWNQIKIAFHTGRTILSY